MKALILIQDELINKLEDSDSLFKNEEHREI